MKIKQAFTLIELLVVIAIIGILSGLIVISMDGAKNAAKDAKRRADIDNIKKALVAEKIFDGAYPIQATICNVGSNCANLSSALIPTYFPSFPLDPSGSYYTYYSSDGTTYALTAVLSSGNIYSASSSSSNYGYSCLAILVAGKSTGSGLYTINPSGTAPFQAYCDMVNDGGGWTLVFNHNVSGGYFANATDALSKNSNNPSADLYSMLDKLEYFRSGDKLTLKINWPYLGTGRNIWSQTINPVLNPGISTTRPVAGYTPISVTYTDNLWGGLEQYTSSAAFLDGSIGSSNWYYAIGSYAAWSGGMPSYSPMSTNVQLWAK